MTTREAQDIEELKAWGEEMASVMNDPREPLCIAQCFASPIGDRVKFTMQTWIDLEAIRSPLMDGTAFHSAEDLSAAFSAFGFRLEGLGPEEAAHVETAIREAIDEAFAMACKMQHPDVTGEAPPDGFGTWLPVFACLVAEMGLRPVEARGLEVGPTLALIAAHRRNQGWKCLGQPYALRDSDQSESAPSADVEGAAPSVPTSINDQPSVIN